jgi:hypothetical protein
VDAQRQAIENLLVLVGDLDSQVVDFEHC